MPHQPVSHEMWFARFETYLHQQGYRPSTIKRHRAVCRQFLQYLHEQQIPLEQPWPAAQPVPHAPQLLVVFNGVQAPLQQPSPLPQAWPQVPQCCGSLPRSTQAAPQAVSPAGQESTQFPCEQL